MKQPVMKMVPNKTKNKANKNLKFEKAKNKLQARIAGFNELCKTRADDGKGFRRPGSLKVR